VVDDSRANVKIMTKLITPSSCSINRDRKQLRRSRSNAYLPRPFDDPEAVMKIVLFEHRRSKWLKKRATRVCRLTLYSWITSCMSCTGYLGLLVGDTGNEISADVNDYIQHGANFVIGKPVNINELKKMLVRILCGHVCNVRKVKYMHKIFKGCKCMCDKVPVM
jgi:hypothetical protein